MSGAIEQIIDAEGEIKEDSRWFDDEEELGSECLAIVAILGPQASGKSTLLNKVFGTAFNVSSRGAVGSAMTKGIAASKAKESDVLVVLDVEGSDARERGKGGRVFQGRCAGFVSSLADVILLNMWYHDIGRLDATGYSLMRSIFFEAIKESGPTKTALIFIIRDAEDDADAEALKKVLIGDAEEIWKAVTKQQQDSQLQGLPLDNFFSFDLVALPHMKHRPREFQTSCEKFGRRFRDHTGGDYLLQTEFSKGIPSDGLATLARTNWGLICVEDSGERVGADGLPGAGEEAVVAAFRCEEAFSDALQAASAKMSELTTALKEGNKVSGLGSKCADILSKSLSNYDMATDEYKQEPIQLRKRRELESVIDTSLQALFMKQLQVLRENSLAHYKSATTSDDVPSDFAFFTSDSQFLREAEESKRPGSSWTFENERNDLQKMMQELSSQRKKLLNSQISAAQHQAHAMQYLQMQQANLQAIEQSSYPGGPGQWNIGAAYRPPDTNVNISMGYQQGRTNIQVSMVPDEAASLLGPNGFTSGVGPANLGLSFNINV